MKIRITKDISCGDVSFRIGEVLHAVDLGEKYAVEVEGRTYYIDKSHTETKGERWDSISEKLKGMNGTPDYYNLDINGEADFYLIAGAAGCPDFPLFHAAKKLLFCGKRGAKDKIQDVTEARDALNRWLQINATT